MPLSLSPQFSPIFTTSYSSSRTSQLSRLWFPVPSSLKKTFSTRVVCVSTRPSRKSGVKTDRSEAEELVRGIIKKFSDKEPLLKTLDKYVRVMRTEHCFLLFEELGKRDKWLQCLEVFRWMQKQRWYIADNGVYSKLISIMGKKGQIRMAMWLFSEMRNSGCRPDTSVYNALITAHLHSKDKAKALVKVLWYFEKMKGMERCKPNIVTYNILTRAFAQAAKVDQVNTLFKDLDESVVSADIYTYNGVMDAYGKNGNIKEMELMLARMKSNQIKPDIISFNLLIDSYGKKQLFDKMEQVFKSLLRSKERPTLPTFNSMITNYGKARLRDKAEEVFRKMKDMGYDPSYVTCESLIMMYGHCDCVSKAREIFDGMVNSGKEVRVSTLNAMLDVYCINGLPFEADMLFESAGNMKVFPDSTTYKLLYKAYTKADMKELLEKLLKNMDKAGIIPNKRFFLDALGTIGSSREKPEPARTKTGSRNSESSVEKQSSSRTRSGPRNLESNVQKPISSRTRTGSRNLESGVENHAPELGLA
ncbi:pentatricopeptide repeat-containing protein [Cucumis melo var. makuwa]|uniref:Pentatricopeptide repeat-containing protein n=1 Tax=Cucumis melo var. makuwa TaxID=1194695 RepID=A0A5A7T266_CUCMM|nr:pentatricopeptide repeat-containing protein [Cucumis melo var. makuwa]